PAIASNRSRAPLTGGPSPHPPPWRLAMSSELVTLLRQQSKIGPINVPRAAMREAAARLEALEADKARLRVVTEAARVVLEWYERDGSVGGAVEPFEALKAALADPAGEAEPVQV